MRRSIMSAESKVAKRRSLMSISAPTSCVPVKSARIAITSSSRVVRRLPPVKSTSVKSDWMARTSEKSAPSSFAPTIVTRSNCGAREGGG